MIAVDTPGFGESFRPATAPSIGDYAEWIARLPLALGFDRWDVLGQFTGAAIAAEMARRFPDRVRRVVLIAPPLFTPAQQAGFVAHAWPMPARADGGHLMFEWGRVNARAAPAVPMAARLDTFVDYYRGGTHAIWGEQAVAVFPLAEVLPELTQPVLVIEPEGVHGDAASAHALLRDGELAPLAVSGYTMMQSHAAVLADLIRDFLDRERSGAPVARRERDRARPRRGFVDIADGQIHFRAARPSATRRGAGSHAAAVAQTPLVCLHQSPFSSLTYQEILPLLARGRETVALDTPGFGESFRPARKPSIADYATWLYEAIAELRFPRFDLLGLFTGAAIAAEIAVRFPDAARRVVLLGPPLFSPSQQERFLREAWPPRPRPDGSHLLPEWERVMTRALPGVDFARRCDAFHEFWRGGGDAIWGEEAVSVYPLRETLPRLRQPVLVLEPDGLHGHAAEAAALIPDARRVRLEGVHAWSMMQTAPDAIAAAVADFLDRDR